MCSAFNSSYIFAKSSTKSHRFAIWLLFGGISHIYNALEHGELQFHAQRTWGRWNKCFLFYPYGMLNCLLHSSLTVKYKNENVIFFSRNHFYFLHCSYFQKQIFLVFCIKVVLGLDLIYSKNRNIEKTRRWIKSSLLSQLSRNDALWNQFHLT